MAFVPFHIAAQDTCDISIGTNFSPSCLLTEYIKDNADLLDSGLTDCLLACRGNTVEYYASTSSTGTFSWNIAGAASYTILNGGRTARVTWGDGESGSVSVTMVNADTSQKCTAVLCILLIESPAVECTTVPAYYLNANGDKVIEICLGQTIDFIDTSYSGDTPIVGCYWNAETYGTSSLPTFSVTPTVEGTFTVTHTAVNECGCESSEAIKVMVKAPIDLELSCYGTSCAYSTETYTIINPQCSEYHWLVEGGTWASNPTGSTVSVTWGNPSSGYGVLSIDGSFCDTECDALVSVRIPVIGPDVEIEGPEEVCVGDIQLYELPLWGSTFYHWTVTNATTGFTPHSYEYPNQYLLEFNQTGTYILECTYECDFLSCGPFAAHTKTIVVKDTLAIHSASHTVCKGDTVHFTTNQGTPVTWSMVSSGGNIQNLGTHIALDRVFDVPGDYTLRAYDNAYCNTAEFSITVRDNPPALTSVSGPGMACPGSSILLSAAPTQPNYYLEWITQCTSANTLYGDEVTVTYGTEVCDVAVRQVDNEYGCRSESYLHEVDTFVLDSEGFPASDSVCIGDNVSYSVPDQSQYGVTYEWKVSPARIATVMGSHLNSSITLMTNYQMVGSAPYTATVTLKREYCSDRVSEQSFTLTVLDAPVPQLSYPDTVCRGNSATFTATFPTATDPNQYTWNFDGTVVHGSNVSHIFTTDGIHDFTVTYVNEYGCSKTVAASIYVQEPPIALLSLAPNWPGAQALYYPNASYSWSYNNVPQPSVTGNVCALGYGTYCCTISYTNMASCESEGCITISQPGTDTCQSVTLSASVNCTTASVTVPNQPGGTYTWNIFPIYSENSITQLSATGLTAQFGIPGNYTISVEYTVGAQCYTGSIMVSMEIWPDVELEYDCGSSVIVTDHSLYLNNTSNMTRTLYVQETGQTYTLTGAVTQVPTTYFQSGTVNHVTVTFSNGNYTCSVSATVDVSLPVINGVTVSQNMCEDTPYLFSVNATNAVSYEWQFGDGSRRFGNSVYHTYNNLQTNPTVTLIVTDSKGCTVNQTASIHIISNILNGYDLKTGAAACPGSVVVLLYNCYNASYNYYWDHSTIPNNSFTYNTYHTGDYHVFVVDDSSGCQAEEYANVKFLNEPTARITGNTVYCYGEKVKLIGNTGPTNTYRWTVTGPNSYSESFTAPNIEFTPPYDGGYTATVTVTNPAPDHCSATAAFYFTVYSLPATPVIGSAGN